MAADQDENSQLTGQRIKGSPGFPGDEKHGKLETRRQRDEDFRLITETIPQGIWRTDPDGSADYVSQRFLELVGYPPEDLLGWNWARHVHPDDRDRVITEWNRCREAGLPVSVEARVMRADGKYRWFLSVGNPLLDENGRVLKYYGTWTDIDETKRLREQLEEKVRTRTAEIQSSQRFLDSLIENLPNMLFVKEANELRFVRFNKAGERLLGLRQDEIIGKNDFDFFPAEQAEHFIADDRSVLAAKTLLDIPEEEISTREQGKRVLHTRKIPILDSEGRPEYLLGISEDITEQKILEAQRLRLVQEEVARSVAERATERMRFLSEASRTLSSTLDFERALKNLTAIIVPRMADGCSVQVLSARGELKEVSASYQNADHLTAKEQAPCAREALVSGKTQWVHAIDDQFLDQINADIEYRRRLRETGCRSYIFVPIRVNGISVGVMCFMHTKSDRLFGEDDVSLAEEIANRAAFSYENARLYREAQEINRAKDEFLATLSHELRTPLNVILGNAEILDAELAPKVNSDLGSSISAIFRNAKLQTQIVNDLLDVSAIITGKVSYVPVAVSPAELAKAVVESTKKAAVSKRIKVTINCDQAPVSMIADSTRLNQIIWNLLSNAIKFTPDGGSVWVRVSQQNDHCVFEIKDTGVGIDPEFLPHVFERFRQQDASTTRKYGGLGLGLSIVKHLVELHGGSLRAESQGTNLGSTFTVTLPLRGPMAQTASLSAEHARSATQARGGLEGLRLLLVEDSADNRVLVSRMLKKVGGQVYEADSAEQAREILRHLRPDIIISDIGMPGENGISFMRKLRSEENGTIPKIPAVALTAYVRQDEISEILAAGFQAHIPKPVSAPELISTIARLTQTESAAAMH